MKKTRVLNLGTNLYKLFSDEASSKTYRQHYSDASFWDKIKGYAKAAGMKVVYAALLLQYMMKSNEVPLKTKLIISAALGYFILPVDVIPDFAPMLGFADDLGVLLLVLKQMASNVTPEIKSQAREHLHKWFGETDSEQLDDLERKIARG
ncbi:MAG: YkvA family protein [Bacteroidales bacterium]